MGRADTLRGIDNDSRADTQSTVAPPQHRLYFLPEPQGHGLFPSNFGSIS